MSNELDALGNTNLLELLLALLPGFLAAEIIAVLVMREDRTVFDRIIQALIYTFVTHAIWNQTPWSQEADPARALIGLGLIAVALGLLVTGLIKSGVIPGVWRRAQITQGASSPDEWYKTFSEKQFYTILHLRDGRRIFGWPRFWPARGDNGHVLLEYAVWLDREDESVAVRKADYLIDVKDVRFVEFLSDAT